MIPHLNREPKINDLLWRLPRFADQVIVSDDAHENFSPEAEFPFEVLVLHADADAYGRSCKRAFASSNGDVIVTLDADHSYPPEAISYLLEAFLHTDVDFLNASRFPVLYSNAMSFQHKMGNILLSLAMSVLYLRWVRDSQSGVWVFRRSILKDIVLESDGATFFEEIKIEVFKSRRMRFAEIPVLYTSRVGETKIKPWRDGFNNLWFLVKKRFSRAQLA